MSPLVLHIVLLAGIGLTGIESILVHQSMITNTGEARSKRSQPDKRDAVIVYKHLGEECDIDEQCEYYTNFAACTSSGAVSVCKCLPDFARKIADPKKCVPATIEVAGDMVLTQTAWNDDMLDKETDIYKSTTKLVADLLLKLDDVVEVKEITIVKKGQNPEVDYVILVNNDEAEQQDRLKRWTVTTKQERVEHGRERRQLPKNVKENMINKINEMAYFQGINVDIIATDMITGKLGSFCIEHSDCTTTGSSCIDSACFCTEGPIKILDDEPYCD